MVQNGEEAKNRLLKTEKVPICHLFELFEDKMVDPAGLEPATR